MEQSMKVNLKELNKVSVSVDCKGIRVESDRSTVLAIEWSAVLGVEPSGDKIAIYLGNRASGKQEGIITLEPGSIEEALKVYQIVNLATQNRDQKIDLALKKN